ncbi:phosphorylase, partial [Blautia sp. MSK22_86]|nr:phosphorylase [Blautia sp. MSK22_86]
MKNTDKLAEFFKERKLPYVQGRVWTTDSMLRETVNLVRKRKEEGCIAVEMELAGVQAIS